MEKIKKLWGSNKVLFVLGGILVVCLIAILIVSFTFFFGGSKSVYGDRLEDIKKHPITEKFKNSYINSLKENEKVEDASMEIKGRVVYVMCSFAPDTALQDAQNIIVASLDKFSEDILSYYDISFTLSAEKSSSSDGFIILGAKNAAGSGLVWNNNNPVESE